jgi:LysM repeat protein
MTAQVTITPVSYPGAALTVALGRKIPTPSDGIAKWNEVTRPRRRNTSEFTSESLLKISFDVVLDQFPDGNVEPLLGRIMGWAAKNALPFQPTLLRISGPIPYPELSYILTGVTWSSTAGDVEFNSSNQRCRQLLDLELTEYQAADLIVQSPPPAQAAQARAGVGTGVAVRVATAATAARTYTVKKGDTLWAIATRELGSGTKWQSIADLNGVRDPRKLQIGQVLKLP